MNELTVIVTVYNVEQYIEQCINSILNQTFKALRIIIVDDGSTDNSGSMCDRFQKENSNITVIHQKNEGMIAARVCGLKNVCTDYVTFVDADDFIERDMYEYMMSYVHTYSSDIVTAGCYRYWNHNDYISDPGSKYPEGFYAGEQFCDIIFPQMFWSPETDGWKMDPSLCFKIIRTDLLRCEYKHMGNQRFNYGEDSAVIYPVLLQSNSIYITHRCFYYHRQRPRDSVAPYIDKEDFFEKLFELYQYMKARFVELNKYDVMQKQLDMFYMKSVQLYRKKYNEIPPKDDNNKWLFPFDKVKPNQNIVLYGAGKAGKVYYAQINKLNYCNIKLWVDKNPINENVVTSDKILETDYDKVVISIQNKDIIKSVVAELVQLGVNINDIVI